MNGENLTELQKDEVRAVIRLHTPSRLAKFGLDSSPIGVWAYITSSYRLNNLEEKYLKFLLGLKQ